MRKEDLSTPIRLATILALVATGCAKKISSAPVPPEGTRTPTSTVGPDFQATNDRLQAEIDRLNEQLATPEAAKKATEAPKRVIEETVWHADTNMEGYQASPIGGLGTTSSIIVETWGPTSEGNKGFVVVVPAGSIMWLQRHYGGTGWSINQLPEGMTVEDLANEHADNIFGRDGTRPAVVVLPGTEKTWPKGGFPLLGCLQTKPVKDNVRHCDPVGGLSGYDAPAAEAEPRYFPGYK